MAAILLHQLTAPTTELSHALESLRLPLPTGFRDTASTLSPAKVNYLSELEATEPGLFSRPKLAQPGTSIEFGLILLLDRFHSLSQYLMSHATIELKEVTKAIEGFLQEKANLMRKAGLRANTTYSALQQIGACFAASFNIALGTFLFTSGMPILGSLVIAAGVFSLANILLQQVKGWEFIAEQIAPEDPDFQMELTKWSSSALTVLSLTLSGLGQIAMLTNPTLSEKAPTVYVQVPGLLSMAAGIVTDIGQAKQSALSSSLSLVEGNMVAENHKKDTICSQVEQICKTTQAQSKLVKKTINIYIQLMRGLYDT